MKIDLLQYLIFLVITLTTVCAYDYLVINPKLKTSRIEVVDIDHILNKNEKLVREGTLSMESYHKRVKFAEEFISKHDTVLLNQYIKVNNKLYPLAFGGIDITDEIEKKLEDIK